MVDRRRRCFWWVISRSEERRKEVEGVKMISKFEEVEKDRDCGREKGEDEEEI